MSSTGLVYDIQHRSLHTAGIGLTLVRGIYYRYDVLQQPYTTVHGDGTYPSGIHTHFNFVISSLCRGRG